MIVENSFTASSVAIFGEVEGVHGHKLGTAKYWSGKQEFCVFGIGAVDGSQKGIYFEESYHCGLARVNLFIEKSHFILNDFLIALNCFRWLFLSGPINPYPSLDEEFTFFSEMIRKNWSSPIDQIFQFLEKFIDGGELVGFNDGEIQIITDLQA